MTEEIRRRQLLGGGALAATAVTTGRLLGPSRAGMNRGAALSASDPAQRRAQRNALQTASFGWEILNAHGNGADVYVEVHHDMVLESADFDVATMITSQPAAPGFQEVLCQAGVSRGETPKFGNVPQVYLSQPQSPDFGSVTSYNPNSVLLLSDPFPFQDKFLSVILKSWVPVNGTASSTSRHVRAEPDLILSRGDYLVFHMDHAGVQVDVEMQVVLGYTDYLRAGRPPE
jgi:hypothetical protein